MVSTLMIIFCGGLSLVGLLALMLSIYAIRFTKVPPEKAMLIYSRNFGKDDVLNSVHLTGGKFIWPFFQRVEFLPTDVRTLKINMKDINCGSKASRLKMNIKMSVKIQACRDIKGIRNAVDHQLKRSTKYVNKMAKQILEDHTRTVALRKPVWEINNDEDAFVKDVEKSAKKDMRSKGLEIRSLVLTGMDDKTGFLKALAMFKMEQTEREAGVYVKGLWETLIASKNPKVAMGLFMRGKHLMKAGDQEGAARTLRIACRMFPDNDKYLKAYMRSLGERITSISLTPEGREDFINRRENAIDDAWREHRRGRNMMEKGMFGQAQFHFKKAIEIDPFESSHRLQYHVCLR